MVGKEKGVAKRLRNRWEWWQQVCKKAVAWCNYKDNDTACKKQILEGLLDRHTAAALIMALYTVQGIVYRRQGPCALGFQQLYVSLRSDGNQSELSKSHPT